MDGVIVEMALEKIPFPFMQSSTEFLYRFPAFWDYQQDHFWLNQAGLNGEVSSSLPDECLVGCCGHRAGPWTDTVFVLGTCIPHSLLHPLFEAISWAFQITEEMS